ncbi:RagB/SusD family nutrient uptake outer membrane protein [Winogradskyella sediminis]|uniref:RagB/SusD family nutrient uptake outer membrane protein n=1 Tax=Winogradskyella sediminis TaxID=1382466 RepID=UPI000E37CE95|nr:RagB/SusD family nutrient uptake outer membrane protein [Winogradskyella sediminis]REG88775.1 SusD-like starch-binding protein associating with outer membrane [Winogradskyella sediminis]
MKNKLKLKNALSYRFIALSLMLLTFASCSKDYLEEPDNTAGLTEDVVFSSRQVTESYIAGILANYKGQYQGSPDAGGIYSLDYARVVKGNDVIQGVSHYRFDYNHENREPNYRRTQFNWDFNYQNVNYANILIQGVSESALSDVEKKEFIAIGKALRAYHHFQLLLDFVPNYANNKDVVRIPFYTERVSLETVGGKAPSSASDIMDQILLDINDAIADLPDSRIGKSYINKRVAYGMKARILAVTKDDWAGMSEAAKMAYGGNAAAAVASINWGNGFNNMEDDEWIWALYQNGTSETNYYWGHTAAFFDHFNLSYQAAYMNPNFVNEFSDTDVRNTFSDFYGVSASVPWREFVSSKFVFGFDSDIVLMRNSEMVLYDAEAQYQLGNIPEAKNLLFALQSNRDPNAVMSANVGTQLFEEILLERRKEMYGEFGTEWFDAKRYNRAINRDAVHRTPVNVPADSPLFYLKIPQTEIDASEFYTDAINQE